MRLALARAPCTAPCGAQTAHSHPQPHRDTGLSFQLSLVFSRCGQSVATMYPRNCSLCIALSCPWSCHKVVHPAHSRPDLAHPTLYRTTSSLRIRDSASQSRSAHVEWPLAWTTAARSVRHFEDENVRRAIWGGGEAQFAIASYLGRIVPCHAEDLRR